MKRSNRPVRSCPRAPSYRARGEWAEAAFLKKALTLGFAVCRPFCEQYRFDFVIVSPSGRCRRIQVKSVWSKRYRGYYLRFTRGGFSYGAKDIDFFACYIGPEDLWYIIPVRDVTGRISAFFARNPPSRRRWERYREAWHLLSRGRGRPRHVVL